MIRKTIEMFSRSKWDSTRKRGFFLENATATLSRWVKMWSTYYTSYLLHNIFALHAPTRTRDLLGLSNMCFYSRLCCLSKFVNGISLKKKTIMFSLLFLCKKDFLNLFPMDQATWSGLMGSSDFRATWRWSWPIKQAGRATGIAILRWGWPTSKTRSVISWARPSPT